MVIPGSNIPRGPEIADKESRRLFMAEIEGTMVIRAWVEPNQDHPLRARLISSHSGQDAELVQTAADADGILLAVKRWLDLLETPESTTSS
jgi:hypothetical protein